MAEYNGDAGRMLATPEHVQDQDVLRKKKNCNNRVSIARLSEGFFSRLHQKVFVEVQRTSKIVASGRQLSDGFNLRRSLALMDPSADDLICFFEQHAPRL